MIQQIVRPISDIIIKPEINTRQIADMIVDEYADAMKEYGIDDWQTNWGEYPKITEDFHLFSGFHTIEAAKKAFGADHTVTFTVDGKDLRQAFFRACAENSRHGRQQSNREKRTKVFRWLLDSTGKTYTDGYIADKCGVSQNFVSSLVKELTGDLSMIDIPAEAFPDGKAVIQEEYHRPSKRRYLRKGKFQYIETEEIGNKPQPKPVKMDEMNEKLYRHTSFSAIADRKDLTLEQIVKDCIIYYNVPKATAESRVEHYSNLRDIVMNEVDDVYSKIVNLCPSIQGGSNTSLWKAIIKLYPEFRNFLTKEHLAVVHLEHLRNDLINLCETIKEIDPAASFAETLIKMAFPNGIPDEKGESLVSWDKPSDLPETPEQEQLPLTDNEHQETLTTAEVDQPPANDVVPDDSSPSPFDNLSETDKQDIGLVEGHISNMLEIEGLPNFVEIASNHLRHAIDAYRHGNEMRFFLTDNPVATQGDVLEQLGYVKVETTD